MCEIFIFHSEFELKKYVEILRSKNLAPWLLAPDSQKDNLKILQYIPQIMSAKLFFVIKHIKFGQISTFFKIKVLLTPYRGQFIDSEGFSAIFCKWILFI